MQNLGEFLNKLHGIKKQTKGFTAQCPSHEDNHNSLSVSQEGERILIKCFVGCTSEAIVEAMGLTTADLFISDKVTIPTISTTRKIACTYDYKDEVGNLLFQTVRYVLKDFSQRHKNGNGEWVNNLQGIRRVLYRLPEILDKTKLYLVEGEKDADNLWKAGFPATTSPMGANAWQTEYAQFLTGKDITIIPDQDPAGQEYARSIIYSLVGKAKSIRIIQLPKKDVSDWLEAGGDATKLESMATDFDCLFAGDKPAYRKSEDAIIWDKPVAGNLLSFKAEKISEERTGIHARITLVMGIQNLGWSYFNIERSEDRTRMANAAAKNITSETYKDKDLRRDLDAFCAGLWEYLLTTVQPEDTEGDAVVKPIVFYLTPYIMKGGGTILFAPPGRGKSYATLLWAVSVDAGITKFWPVIQSKILFINLERSKESVARRLAMVNLVLGLPPNRKLLMLHARGRSLHDVIPACRKAIRDKDVKIVFLDSISRAGYGDLNDNRPVNAIMDALSGLCDTWIAIAHTPRADESHIFGGVHFEAAADLVVQLSAEAKDSRTLGIGFQITKRNDLPAGLGDNSYALQFGEHGLCGFRTAESGEFPELENKAQVKKPSREQITDYILNTDNTEASATEIAQETGLSRQTVFKILTIDSTFAKRENKRGREVLYGFSPLGDERNVVYK